MSPAEVAIPIPAVAALSLMTRRILLSTIHASDNYGSVLQAKCLVNALAACGEVEVLDYRPIRINVWYAQDWIPYQRFRKRFNPEFLEFIGKHKKMKHARQSLPLTRRVLRPKACHYSGYDTVVVGSDEMWSPVWGDLPAYFLADVPASVRRVAYAVSAGTGEALGASALVPEWVAAFDAIHPRDDNTADLCRRVGVVPDEVVCDPVMLADRDWLSAIGGPASNISRPYTLLYAEHCRRDRRVDQIIRTTGAPATLVSVGFPYPEARSMVNAGLPDFVAAIAGAELVVTSMFHGLVTGLSFGKTVAVLHQPDKTRKVSDLIARVGTVVASGTGYEVVSPSARLVDFQEASRRALSAALS